MRPNRPDLFRPSALLGITALALLAWAPPTQARVTRIIIDTKTSPAFGGQSFGAAGQYETLAGRAFGSLDPTFRSTRSSPTSTRAEERERAGRVHGDVLAGQSDRHAKTAA